MAGHSKFKNIQFRKGAQDKKRARVFSRLTREITVAARAGLPEPDKNPRLRAAIQAARAQNMPKDNITRAIRRSGDESGGNYQDVRYEGFGPGGVGIIVETLTDNRNRTAGDLRALFSKHGGSLGETGSVSFLFDQMGEVIYPPAAAEADAMFEAALAVGATDCDSGAESHQILCDGNNLHAMAQALEKQFGEPNSARLVWTPKNTVSVDGDDAKTLFALLDALDDNDDVQNIHANFDVPDDVLDALSAA